MRRISTHKDRSLRTFWSHTSHISKKPWSIYLQYVCMFIYKLYVYYYYYILKQEFGKDEIMIMIKNNSKVILTNAESFLLLKKVMWLSIIYYFFKGYGLTFWRCDFYISGCHSLKIQLTRYVNWDGRRTWVPLWNHDSIFSYKVLSSLM